MTLSPESQAIMRRLHAEHDVQKVTYRAMQAAFWRKRETWWRAHGSETQAALCASRALSNETNDGRLPA